MDAEGLRAGVTGHQDLPDPAWVRGQLAAIVGREPIGLGLTSLARGTDQIFASLLQEEGISYRVIVPSAGYEAAFQDARSLSSYRRLRAAASSVSTLPFEAPSEEAFLAAGIRIVEECSLLIAVWDGLPAKGLGGTGDIVSIALERGRRVIHVNIRSRTVTAVAANRGA